MSAQTKSALESALQAHISDESDDEQLVTGYILGCAITSFREEEAYPHSYWFEQPDGTPAHVARGLADIITEWAGTASIFQQEEDE